jgi:hypothetical protein
VGDFALNIGGRLTLRRHFAPHLLGEYARGLYKFFALQPFNDDLVKPFLRRGVRSARAPLPGCKVRPLGRCWLPYRFSIIARLSRWPAIPTRIFPSRVALSRKHGIPLNTG